VEARWLIEAKFAPPAQIRRQIERTRILDQLAPEANRLIVIQAAAGFGKSTLLAQWAGRLIGAGTLVAWLNLDEDDRQPELFATYLVEAFRRCLATVSAEGAVALANHTDLPAKAALTAIVTELDRRNRPIALILDDYHRAESEEIDAVMRLFLDRVPACVSVAIASRSLPRLGLARLKAENRATVVLDRDLRFNEGETSLFFAAEMPRLDHADWIRFTARAEGWPVALQFARMWLNEGGSLSALSAASEANDLGSYLSEQVFGTLTPEQQDFLLRTSPLETVSEDVAEAIGIDKAAAQLKELARSALPIVILSPEPLRLRYHHLFRDFLISRAGDRDVDLLDIHRRAAGWFALSGDLASAVRHALAGKDAGYAAAIVEKAGGWRLVYRRRRERRFPAGSRHACCGLSPRAACPDGIGRSLCYRSPRDSQAPGNSRARSSTRARSSGNSPGTSSRSRIRTPRSASGSDDCSVRAARKRRRRVGRTISGCRAASARFSSCSRRDSPTRRSAGASGSIRTPSNIT